MRVSDTVVEIKWAMYKLITDTVTSITTPCADLFEKNTRELFQTKCNSISQFEKRNLFVVAAFTVFIMSGLFIAYCCKKSKQRNNALQTPGSTITSSSFLANTHRTTTAIAIATTLPEHTLQEPLMINESAINTELGADLNQHA